MTYSSLCSIAQADNFNTISTLNTRATWKANGLRIPPDMDTAFNTFVNELGLNRDKSLTDGTTSLSKAYYAFWAARKKHKE